MKALPTPRLGIPKKLHFTWVQGRDAMPAWAKFNVDTWRALNPEAEVVVHDAESMLAAVQAARMPTLLAAYKTLDTCYVRRKDMAQFAILLQHGGLHIDVDLQCQKCVDDLLGANTLLAFDCDLSPVVHVPAAALQLVGAIPGHPVIRATVAGMAAAAWDLVTAGGGQTRDPCSLASTQAVGRVWPTTFAALHQTYVSTPLQYFLQPAWMAGLEDPRSRLRPLFRGTGYAFLTTPQGSWHSPLMAAYHKSAVWGVHHKVLVQVLLSAVGLLLLVVLTVMVGALLGRRAY